MPKRVGYLYARLLYKGFIKLAIIEGSRGKKKRWDVKLVLSDIDNYVDKIFELILNETYVPTEPKKKTIYEKNSMKWRDIKVVPFYPDGIIQQMVVMAMKDVLMRGMYRWSCASVPGRGNLEALHYTEKAIRNDPKNTKHCYKADIKNYYGSIDRQKLMEMLRRKIKDKKFLHLVELIIYSDPEPGLSIGFYINQWLANFYMEPVDRFICTLDGVEYYVRNMDDIVLMGPNKKKLHKAHKAIETFVLDNLGLTIKENWQVFPVNSRGIDFVGYRIFRDYTILRKRNFLKYTRNSVRIKKMIMQHRKIPFRLAAGLLSRSGQLKHCNGITAKQKYLYPIGVKFLKKVVKGYTSNICV